MPSTINIADSTEASTPCFDADTPHHPDLGETFAMAFDDHRARPALVISDRTFSYGELMVAAHYLSGRPQFAADPTKPVGIIAERSVTAFAAVMAAVWSRRPYVPISMKHPIVRQKDILAAADCGVLIFDDASRGRAVELAADRTPPPALLTLSPDEVEASSARPSLSEGGSSLAYIMFTSGTTGQPKGVAVQRTNVAAYLAAIREIAPIEPGTRCTQMFDLAFDLSVHDMLRTWSHGGCLYVANTHDLLNPVGFARRHRLQSWFSVPSLAAFALKGGRADAGPLPDLAESLFCGEALPMSLAEAWARIAPNAKLLNLYGPTETTIAATAHVFSPGAAEYRGMATVPIGLPLSGSEFQIMMVKGFPDGAGELLLGGSQVSSGYINDPPQQASRFLQAGFENAVSTRWYSTGDVVRKLPNGQLIFEGRLDDQIKINGYRVELMDVEAALRDASGCAEVAAGVAPQREGRRRFGIVGFVCGSLRSEQEILDACRETLPTYMRPRRIVFVDEMPLNANGKLDRRTLIAGLLPHHDQASRP